MATAMDLFSRRIVGWSMGKHIDRHLMIDALLMAKLRRQPRDAVFIHSDQAVNTKVTITRLYGTVFFIWSAFHKFQWINNSTLK